DTAIDAGLRQQRHAQVVIAPGGVDDLLRHRVISGDAHVRAKQEVHAGVDNRLDAVREDVEVRHARLRREWPVAALVLGVEQTLVGAPGGAQLLRRRAVLRAFDGVAQGLWARLR